jgi:starch synthase (maltosyl-transferring)
VIINRKKTLFSAWYELFPRYCSTEINQHGTFLDCEKILSDIANLGFDILYFPPIHPQLGSLNDLHRLIKKAKEYGIEIALDLAFPDTENRPLYFLHLFLKSFFFVKKF